MVPSSSPSASAVFAARSGVDRELTSFCAGHRAQLLEIGEELAPAMDALEAMISGGKRLRPTFCYWGWRGAGGAAEDERVVRAAASLEFLQACALVHDDVIDNSDTRRGLPATHKRLAKLHADQGWSGDSEGFGQGAAILIGDLCLAWSDEMYQASGFPTEVLGRGRPPFDAMRTEVMAGQYLDTLEQVRGTGTREAALRVMRYKSAKYTVERPLHLGAALAGRHGELAGVYTDYGIPLGIAFQLRDDVLGVFGDPSTTGKPAGDDLREGKRTLVVAETLARAGAADAERFRSLLGAPDLSVASVEWMCSLIEGSGALAACEEMIAEYADRAVAALESPELDASAREPLRQLVVAATSRSF
ncbi:MULTISPECIES: polyprenyl synthetase family protein [Nocardiopsis]|uniref:Polyprenyl synthetase n=1 Tax=Nocardiopsis dassonvillei (strain ATCC 23218 / DSM 43111 / CIP 107115 / JCM 7437 / KCTC 9190 / NBRC 14626 / NCTC 10488 / NRRL B-5397 / IMRU 509) TaxID=446468 RepID=D7B1U3_NOCDD|nr:MULTISPECIES: polyprenyl synthetase family protein [Nocardiopsis]ADH68519.1 Polyprenyl synthetase [Nocardiopsis dassonvillei subsp. dassonvillei DSM 43111]APC36599.1 polyprenyl synthetase [Nocardiopsis dassonvillei]NKY80896.1 polyprenyl synthetase family protein [Nocardiopsis dassonvillei]VEI89027.1 Octaprenyl-diphosphate synthase [Nocardiopsis dassonvillei]